jgi:hypothetical protein
MEKIQQYLSENPALWGILVIVLGALLMLASIFDWDWLFGQTNPYTYNARKIDGLINLFGRKTARIVFGAISFLIIMAGFIWIWFGLYK